MSGLVMTWPDYVNRRVQVDGVPVRMSRMLIDLLATLLINRGRTLSMATLIEALWPNPFLEPEYSERSLYVHIYKLRRLIGAHRIITMHRQGFRIPHEHEFERLAA